MMIKAPSWKKDAIPSTRGWHDPRTNELLLVHKHSESDVKEWLGKELDPPVDPVHELTVEFDNMNKNELEAWGREKLGVEVDRRKSRAKIIEFLKSFT